MKWVLSLSSHSLTPAGGPDHMLYFDSPEDAVPQQRGFCQHPGPVRRSSLQTGATMFAQGLFLGDSIEVDG